jgi:hypothetical protein
MHERIETLEYVDRLKAQIFLEGKVRYRGYAVDLGDGRWYFFQALEPAYAFARAGRMAATVSSFAIHEATREIVFDPETGRDEVTLQVLRCPIDVREHDRDLVLAFATGLEEDRWQWPPRLRNRSER